MGRRSRERRARRAWLVSWLLPYAQRLAERVRKARPRAAYRLGRRIGDLLYALGVTRRVLRRNLRLACGRDLAPAERRRFERAYYRHLGLMLVEFLRLPTWTRGDLASFGPAVDEVRRIYGEGSGVIFVAGHAGLWELAGHVAGLCDVKLLSVAKLSGHAELDAWVTSLRESSRRGEVGQRIRDVNGSLWAMKKALDRGEAVGINVDQEARKGMVFAPFFGIPAATSNAPALLHLKTGAPIVVATVHRIGPFRYRLGIYDVIRHEPSLSRDEDVLAITARINRAMEAMIQDHPEQWLWSHRRWRRRPPGEADGALRRVAAAPGLEL
ncbi:MAG: hypothetical protein D6731_19780 [Planctomycetota bacterium]|nr:MAG: hypothetical protein D6731_19780 [Planctomycetota bacterium]